MPSVLVIYASTHGHTAKIAARIGDALRAEGIRVELCRVSTAAELDVRGYDGVVVGASIHAGHHQREVVDWVKRHRAGLGGVPSAFFSVCLSAAEDSDESRQATRKYVQDFTGETGWSPTRTTSFAGALQYREYDFATRLLMRLLMRRGGHPTDASQDYDFTDWPAVERFGQACADLIRTASVTT